MQWVNTFYRIVDGDCLIATTDVDGIPSLLESLAPGRYPIDKVTSAGGLLLKIETLRWGWVVKHKDGRVEILPVVTTTRDQQLP